MASNLYQDFGSGPANFKTILEQISNEDIMFQYEGVSSLRNALAMAQESQLLRFPYESFCEKLIALVKQPALMEISNEIKHMAIQSVVNIMDIYPQHIGYLVSMGIGAALKETMEQSMGYIDLVEQCIKCCEKVSLENPREILKHGILPMALNMIDFFDKSTQTKILQLLLNVSSSSESESDFQSNFLPVVPNICQMLQSGVQSESDRAKIERLTTVLLRLTQSVTGFLSPLDSFTQIGQLFSQISNAGVHDTILHILRQYSNYVQATQKQSTQIDQSQQQIQINTESMTTQTFSELTISNLLKVLQGSCQYSHLIVMQLISAGIFEIIDPLLPCSEGTTQREDTLIVTDVLQLCQNLLPAQDDFTRPAGDEGEIIQVGVRKRVVDPSKCPSYLEARKQNEASKKQFFAQQPTQLHNCIAKNLLPKIFVAYSQHINIEFRTKCLSLIQRMLSVLPQSLLKESFDPATFTKFVHMILRTHQPQQVLCCLLTVQQLLASEYGTQLAVFFIRHGIRETIKEYTSEETVEKLNSLKYFCSKKQVNPQEMKHEFLEKEKAQILLLTQVEKEKITGQLEDMKLILESVQGAKKLEIQSLIKKHETTLKTLQLRQSDLQAIPDLTSQIGREEENVKEPIPQVGYGTRISEVASSITSKYIDNADYWANVQAQHPQDVKFFSSLCQLATELHQQSCLSEFDKTRWQELIGKLSQVLTAEQGLTSFEFEKSGLLSAIQSLLTMSSSEATETKYEESKQTADQLQSRQISKQEAVTYVKRLKLFVEALCRKMNGKLPFKQLLNLCHEQLTLAEPLIFKEVTSSDYQGQVEALHQLSRSIIINLVYDHDGKQCGQTTAEEHILTKAKSVGLPFDHLQAPQETSKSLIFIKRQQLYEKLKEVPLNIQKCDNINLLEEFLLKRIKTQDDVQALIKQTQKHFNFLGKMGGAAGQSGDSSKVQLDTATEQFYQKCLDRMTDFIDECLDQQVFFELQPGFIQEIDDKVKEWEQTNKRRLPEAFWTHWSSGTQSFIKSTVLQDQEDRMDNEDMDGEDMELILSEISVKTASFLQLIQKVKTQSQQSLPHPKKPADVSMDEVLDNSEAFNDGEEDEDDASHDHDGEDDDQEEGEEDSQPIDQSEDVEMTEELAPNQQPNNDSDPSHEVLEPQPKSSSHNSGGEEDAEMSEVPSSEHHKPFEYKKPTRAQDLMTIEELLKENNNEDIEIIFYYNKRVIDKNTSFYEICKDSVAQVPTLLDADKQSPAALRAMMQRMIGGAYDCRTIYFTIRDRQPQKIQLQRKDSLIEYAHIRQRTKSMVVEDVSAQSINLIVQNLINDFAIKDLPKPDAQSAEKSLEDTLKLTKALHYVYNNLQMFTTLGVSFLLGTPLNQQKSTQDESSDFDIQTLSTDLGQASFNHSKLDSNLQKAIQDPYKLVSGGINETLKTIFSSCSFLFSFDTKMLYLRLVSFISVDMNRSLFFLRAHLKKHGLKKQLPSDSQRDEPKRQSERQRIRMDRKLSIVQQSLSLVKDIKKRAILEVVYKEEEGTGLGPTLEFYSTLAQELRSDKSMWRQNVQDGTLYPRGLQISADNQAEVRFVCEKFQLAGTFVARSIYDDRLMELPICQLMWDLIFYKKKNLFDLKKLDLSMFTLFSELQLMANRKQEVDQMNLASPVEKQSLLNLIRSSKNASIEDYDLSFYDPNDDTVELVKDGRNICVTLDNLQQYIDLVLDSTFNESIRLQITAFKKGFNSVMPIENLKIFQSSDEIETLVCGESSQQTQSNEWSSLQNLSEVINTAHGYHQKSKSFREFLRYLTEIQPKDRSAFVQFMTGSPRLPIGGFGGLEPRLTLVQKKPSNPSEKPDQILPSVMTCQNYVKMPEYSSYEVLKQRFDLAIREGAKNFTLS